MLWRNSMSLRAQSQRVLRGFARIAVERGEMVIVLRFTPRQRGLVTGQRAVQPRPGILGFIEEQVQVAQFLAKLGPWHEGNDLLKKRRRTGRVAPRAREFGEVLDGRRRSLAARTARRGNASPRPSNRRCQRETARAARGSRQRVPGRGVRPLARGRRIFLVPRGPPCRHHGARPSWRNAVPRPGRWARRCPPISRRRSR